MVGKRELGSRNLLKQSQPQRAADEQGSQRERSVALGYSQQDDALGVFDFVTEKYQLPASLHHCQNLHNRPASHTVPSKLIQSIARIPYLKLQSFPIGHFDP